MTDREPTRGRDRDDAQSHQRGRGLPCATTCPPIVTPVVIKANAGTCSPTESRRASRTSARTGSAHGAARCTTPPFTTRAM